MEKIEIEWIQRDGVLPAVCNVHLCRTATRGRHANVTWKTLMMVQGEIEKWPKRWSLELRASIAVQAVKTLETNLEKYMAGERIELVPPIKNPNDLLRSLRPRGV